MGRVAIKLSPGCRFHDVHDEDPVALYSYVINGLNDRGLAYLQITDTGDYYCYEKRFDPLALARVNFGGVLVANGGYDLERSQRCLAESNADAVAFGTSFISNPDLPNRLRTGAPLSPPNPKTFYTQGQNGYNDYPLLGETDAAQPPK